MAIFTFYGMLNNSHVHIKAPHEQLIAYDVLHNMIFFLPAEIEPGVSQSDKYSI